MMAFVCNKLQLFKILDILSNKLQTVDIFRVSDTIYIY